MRKNVVISLCIFFLVLCIIMVTMQTSVDAYLNGLAFGANPPLLDLDLDYLTRLAAVDSYTGTLEGLYGLYGLGGLYGLYGGGLYGLYGGGLYGLYGLGTLPILNYIGYLYGTYGTNIENIYTNPAGLSPNIWTEYGFTYHPLLGYYQPLNLFGSMFALTNLLTWW